MIGMLVFHQARRQHDRRPHAPENGRQLDGVRGTDFKMGIAVELDEFQRRAQDLRGLFCLARCAVRRAVRAGLAARADDEVRRPARRGFRSAIDAAAPEFDVVGVRAKREQRRRSAGSSV